MAVYILHIDPPYQHAKHYIGYTVRPIKERVAEHLAGRGSPLVAAALAAGHSVTVSLKWVGGNRAWERYLKRKKETPRWCPCCISDCSKPKPNLSEFKRKRKDGWRY
jgi:predicted GIY-YIG superfamily endonuclease